MYEPDYDFLVSVPSYQLYEWIADGAIIGWVGFTGWLLYRWWQYHRRLHKGAAASIVLWVAGSLIIAALYSWFSVVRIETVECGSAVSLLERDWYPLLDECEPLMHDRAVLGWIFLAPLALVLVGLVVAGSRRERLNGAV